MGFMQSVSSFFTAIWEFITNIVEGTLLAMNVISSSIGYSLQLVGLVPALIGSCIICVLGIGIVKVILGWGNS